MMLNALIVDDDNDGRTSLEILIKKHFSYLFGKIVTASSITTAIQIISKHSFDICFLDFELSDQSGFDLLSHLDGAKVIFMTPYSEHAIRALREKAYDYLLKPFTAAEFVDCLKRIERENNKESPKFLLVKQQGFTVPVDLNEIVYLEAKGPYSKVVLANNNQYMMSKTLKTLSERLGSNFIRIHRSYLVNKAMVQSFKKGSLITTGNVSLPVSRLGSKVLSKHFSFLFFLMYNIMAY